MNERSGARTADAVDAVVAALAASAPGLRQSLLDVGRVRGRSVRGIADSATDAYLHQADAANEVFSGIHEAAWALPAAPYSWTLHGLVAHLLQIERAFERAIGLTDALWRPDAPDDSLVGHLELGAAAIEEELARQPRSTLADWRASVARIASHLSEVDLDRTVMFNGWPFAVRTLFVARSFELWTHADDARRALGRPLASPSAADLTLMAATAVEGLPLAIQVVRHSVPNASARVVLTGDGGGTWDLRLGDVSGEGEGEGEGGGVVVSIVADVVDWCRLASGRLHPDELVASVEGDLSLALHLLRAAAVVAI